MAVATRPLFAFDDSYARELDDLSVPWEGAAAAAPKLTVLNEELAAELGADPDALREPAGLAVLTGSASVDGSTPVAMAYAGHQFGSYAPLLGDGRALLLGEVVDRRGKRRDLHLKGSGPTPFARGGDGRAALGPMLRELLVGEAMHALGIPTTRGLAVVETGEQVARDRLLPGAVLARVAASHVRVGTFQLAASRPDPTLVRRLADHVIARHHPDGAGRGPPVPRALRGGGRRAGVAGRPVDAGRLRARGHEHRQHDDLRREHRLRPVCVHRRVRPGSGLQLDRSRRPLRLRQPAARSRSGTWPGWPRRC